MILCSLPLAGAAGQRDAIRYAMDFFLLSGLTANATANSASIPARVSAGRRFRYRGSRPHRVLARWVSNPGNVSDTLAQSQRRISP
jgi:hypothetical protein